ncbi:hypothetical protein JOS77_31330 [Chromobacterium haemolyticum]|nr:hypothetical protein JOS77_31330 [Chromobacterium haemolyticum]
MSYLLDAAHQLRGLYPARRARVGGWPRHLFQLAHHGRSGLGQDFDFR